MGCWGRGRWIARVAVALALLCAAAEMTRADVLVDGDEAAVRVVARQASVAEVFAALQSKFRFRYNLAVSPERQVSGTIAGPLHQVVARLLDGYDYVVKRAPDGVEVVRVAPRGTASWAPTARPGVTVWQVPAAQAMRPARNPE
jgi:hypothetical protein